MMVKQAIGSLVENGDIQMSEADIASEIDDQEELNVIGFLQVIEELFDMLEKFNAALRERVMSRIREEAKLILQKSDQV